ncbi:hypothetical protein OHA09_36285 [Streptomyces longwoodensis]|uniref:hypothetical protein n=1 Tax=Streptomyces longwoodensis TaxID=68231 RepID=UPI002E8019CC|nr:hypothetical protein [Streptomyces longwoodensis]WUC55706.1 hypothetical protein OHA09_00685 [Streptomyces longwoodensis]WUC62174.1 hypothetical protein OHA09_36285 [Streptomyces longwoodensis]
MNNSIRALVILVITSLLAVFTWLRLLLETLLLSLPARSGGRPGGRAAHLRLLNRQSEVAAATE